MGRVVQVAGASMGTLEGDSCVTLRADEGTVSLFGSPGATWLQGCAEQRGHPHRVGGCSGHSCPVPSQLPSVTCCAPQDLHGEGPGGGPKA